MEKNSETGREMAGLNLNHDSLRHLMGISKWARFIAIVMISLFAILWIGLVVLIILNRDGSGMFVRTSTLWAVIPLALASFIYLLVFLYLNRFYCRMKEAVTGNSNESLEKAFLNMKYFFRLMGITLIVYLVGFIISITVLDAIKSAF